MPLATFLHILDYKLVSGVTKNNVTVSYQQRRGKLRTGLFEALAHRHYSDLTYFPAHLPRITNPEASCPMEHLCPL